MIAKGFSASPGMPASGARVLLPRSDRNRAGDQEDNQADRERFDKPNAMTAPKRGGAMKEELESHLARFNQMVARVHG